jgi:GTP-binding protein
MQEIDEALDSIEDSRDFGDEERNLPMVAIVGRPNVGKSTLFNRIIGRRKAVVHDRPGVTRDRNIDIAEWDGLRFLCVDTGGYETKLDDPLLESVVEQVHLAIYEADVILLMMAALEHEHPTDPDIVGMLRSTDKPVFMVVNKADNEDSRLAANEFYRYGLERIIPVSALHGIGIGDLLSDVVSTLKKMEKPGTHQHGRGSIQLAIVGRQNVGKSTLVNQMAGFQRVIASPVAGTTRDSIDQVVNSPDGRKFTLIDTAGIRRRGKIERGIEKMSVFSAIVSMRRADVAVILIDVAQGIKEQDSHIAGYCQDYGLASIVLVNKWDLVEKDHRTADEFTRNLEERWKFMRYSPVLYVSALTGQRTRRIFDVAERIYLNAARRIDTHELNERLVEWVGRKPPVSKRVQKPKVRFMTQTGIHPPTFTLFVNDPQRFHFSYRRYIVNRLREAYDFEGTPIRLFFRTNRTHREDDPEDIKVN